jgi:transcriptional regulator with XRE-family HTH domain
MRKPLLPGSKRYDLAKTIGRRIRAFRRERKFRQDEVAAMVGVRPSRIAAYEEGLAIPPPFTLMRLSQVLRTTVDGLMSDEAVVPLNNQQVIDSFREVSALPLASQIAIASFVRQIVAWIKAMSEGK